MKLIAHLSENLCKAIPYFQNLEGFWALKTNEIY